MDDGTARKGSTIRGVGVGQGVSVDLLVGGFGPLAGETSPGIEWLHLTRVPQDDGSPAATLAAARPCGGNPVPVPGGGRDDGTGDEAVSGADGDSDGRGAVDEDVDDGVAVSRRFVLADVPSPTWLTSRGDLVLAVLENTGELVSFRWVPRGGDRQTYGPFHIDGPSLRPLSRVPVPGPGPTHAAICRDDRGEGRVVVADYGNGTIAVHPLDATGHLGIALQTLRPDPKDGHGPFPAQDGSHAHWALPLPDGRVLTTDLGTDRIHVHRWHGGRLVRIGTVVLSPGTGPRDMHLLPMPGGGWRVAVVGEWGNDVTVLEPYAVPSADDPSGDEPCGNVGDAVNGVIGVAHGRVRTGASPAEDPVCADDGEGQDGGMRVVQRIALGGDEGDQAASLAFVPDVMTEDGSRAERHGSDADSVTDGAVYVGLRGSDRIVVLRWRDGVLSMPRPGISVPSGGGRPRHILAVGSLLVVSNETTSRLAFFRVGVDRVPVPVGGTLVGSPTVALPMVR